LKVRWIIVYGLTFHRGGEIYDGDDCIIRACGFEGGVGIGTIDHDKGCINNLIEDVWSWGKEVRLLASNYRAHHNTWRRIALRPDGCSVANCGESSGNYVVGITVYNSHDVTLENVIVFDRVQSPAGVSLPYFGYSDFATAQHDSARPAQPEGELLGNNQWLGCMSVHSFDTALDFEADAVTTGTTATVREFVALDTADGLWFDPAHAPYTGSSTFDVDQVRSYTRGGASPFNSCSGGCKFTMANIVTGTYAVGQGSNLPANRYGTSTALWPWPHEDVLRKDVCATEKRGLCSAALAFGAYLHSL
jgi:hypothetical protein